MEKNILRIFGNLAAVQMKYDLQRLGAFDKMPFSLILLTYGSYTFEVPKGDKRQTDRLESMARDFKMLGLEVDFGEGEMKDGSWSHSGSNYIDCLKLKVSLPTSPAVKVLYAKSNKG